MRRHQQKSPWGYLQIAVFAVLSTVAFHGITRAAPFESDEPKPFESSQRLVSAISVPQKLARDLTLSSEMTRLHISAVSIAVIQNGAILWAKGFGQTHMGGSPTSTSTRFQGASFSKTVTAVAVLRLVEQGRLNLDEDVNSYLERWKLPTTPGQRVTLRQLLSHTAGLNVSGFPGYRTGNAVPSIAQILDGAAPATTPPVQIASPPDSAWNYSGGGYTVIQQLLVDVTDTEFPQLMQDLVLGPAGMTHSSFIRPLTQSMIAMPYRADGKLLEGGPYTYPALAAAGLWTTPSDMASFIIELQRCAAGRGTLLSQATTKEMFSRRLGSWGLGFRIEGDGASHRFGHDGGNEGYKSTFVGYLSEPSGAVVMTNGDNGTILRTEVLRTIAAQYSWKGYEPLGKTIISLPINQTRRLVGTYSTSTGRQFEITFDKDHLLFRSGVAPMEMLLATTPISFLAITGDLKIEWNAIDGASGTISAAGTTLPFTRSLP